MDGGEGYFGLKILNFTTKYCNISEFQPLSYSLIYNNHPAFDTPYFDLCYS